MFRKWTRYYLRLTDQLWCRLIIAIFTVAPTLGLTFLQNSMFQAEHPLIADWYKRHPKGQYLLLLCPTIFLFLGIIQSAIVKHFKSYELPQIPTILALLEGIRDAVSKKSAHLSAQVRRKKGLPSLGLPDEISDPVAQINVLVRSVYSVFSVDANSEPNFKLKVTLARIGEDKLFSKFVCYLPQSAPPMSEKLRCKNTAFAVAVRENKMVIISNIAKELKKEKKRNYTSSGNEIDDVGSIIAYPLLNRHLNQISLVLCVKCSVPHYFSDRSRERYEFLIEPFAQRILLEYNNLLLKDTDL